MLRSSMIDGKVDGPQCVPMCSFPILRQQLLDPTCKVTVSRLDAKLRYAIDLYH